MAKKKATARQTHEPKLPREDSEQNGQHIAGDATPRTETQKPQAEVTAPSSRPDLDPPRRITIEIPIGELTDHEYLPEGLNFRLLGHKSSRSMRAALKRVFRALHTNHAVMSNGRHVDNPTDAVRWILDQIAEKLEAEERK